MWAKSTAFQLFVAGFRVSDSPGEALFPVVEDVGASLDGCRALNAGDTCCGFAPCM